jgi:hypothetical protein
MPRILTDSLQTSKQDSSFNGENLKDLDADQSSRVT